MLLIIPWNNLFSHKIVNAQGIGIGTHTHHASALVDMNTGTKGMLPPRLTTAQRKAIANPAAGLRVFDTDKGCLFLFYGVI
jgi:hypothetical protein